MILPQLAIQTPTKSSPPIAYIQLIQPVSQPRFPDRRKEAKAAEDYLQEQARIAAQKAQEALIAQEQAQVAPTPSRTPQNLPAGSHTDWMALAGIDPSDYQYVEYIISHESGWQPCIHNGGTIDCSYLGGLSYGLPQSMPGSKMASAGADWQTNPITQLRWANGYVKGRYGGWAGAYNYWLKNHNY